MQRLFGASRRSSKRFVDAIESSGAIKIYDEGCSIAAAVAAAVVEKRWAIAEVLATEVQRRRRERTLSNVVPSTIGSTAGFDRWTANASWRRMRERIRGWRLRVALETRSEARAVGHACAYARGGV